MDDIAANGMSAFTATSWAEPNHGKIKSLWDWYQPEDTPLRISISGVAGTGKKKLARSLARKLDITAITGVPRTIKEIGGSINKNADMEDEFLAFIAQVWEQQEYQEFVTAGSLIDLIAHMDYIATIRGTKKDRYLLDGAANLINVISNNTYSVLFYLPFREKPKADGIRSVDTKYLREIDRLIHFYLDAYDLDYLPLDGTHSEKSKIAMNYMEDFGLLDERDL